MKTYLKFNMPEEEEQFKDAMNGTKYRIMLDDIWNEIFRPSFKHGYSSETLNKVFYSDSKTVKREDVMAAFEELSEIYRKILTKYE